MRVLSELPNPVRTIEHETIATGDGVRLSARLWIPEGAGSSPVPTVIEAIPYRKRLGTRLRDEPIHGYLAGHGLAAVRLDLRGTGESGGHITDEYTEREHRDIEEALAWIARQPWSNGAVGMLGKSWGGIAALQVAARGPPGLRAIVTVCGSDDRYGLDAHYEGGCLLTENLTWGTAFMLQAALPPDPRIVGEEWREMWTERLARLPLFPARWMEHPLRDPYWRRGSVCEDYRRIRVPVLAVGGWADPYCTSVLRLLAELDVPRRGWIGPWAHVYPHDGWPGPAAGFLQECVRWFRRWLTTDGGSTGSSPESGPPSVEDPAASAEDPILRAFLQEGFPVPSADAGSAGAAGAGTRLAQPGRWMAEEHWPSPRVRTRAIPLPAPGPLEIPWDLRIGRAAGAWCPFEHPEELPGDQAEDDARSLSFDLPALEEPLEILGIPKARLRLEADRPVAMVAVRLCDVAPDGRSRLVSYGLRALHLSDDFAGTRMLRPGEPLAAEVSLRATGYLVPAGHRLRIALSSSLWPVAWPPPERVRLAVDPTGSEILLPVRETAGAGGSWFPEPPEAAAGAPHRPLDPEPFSRAWREEGSDGSYELVQTDLLPDGGASRLLLEEPEATIGSGGVVRYRIGGADPASALCEAVRRAIVERDGWHAEVEVSTRLEAAADAYRLLGRVRAELGRTPIFERTWLRVIPRSAPASGGDRH